MMEKKKSFTEKIGKEIVDEVLEVGLSFLLVVFGINYFNLESKWVEAGSLIADRVGINSFEVTLMWDKIANTFPFSFIGAHSDMALIIGLLICIVGFAIKITTIKSRNEFIRDLGKILLIPGVIGIVALIIVQLLTMSSINELLVRSSLASTQLALNHIQAGVMIWSMMGVLFLVGLFSLIIGAVLVYVIRSVGGKPVILHLTGKFLTVIGWIGLGFYILIRILAMESIANSLYGSNVLKLFAFSWYLGKGTFMVSASMLALGYVLFKYGNQEIRRARKRRLMHYKRPLPTPHKPYY
ncbi:hypothetical protein KY339_05585 [Candidatus Woesearchaeota archaeon]|nr:hypothetical protein [Candidatus Woesearchaeota archaeon]